jgi:hypothetical protein
LESASTPLDQDRAERVAVTIFCNLRCSVAVITCETSPEMGRSSNRNKQIKL